MSNNMCFKDYLTCTDDEKKVRKKMNKKSHKGRYYGTIQPNAPSTGGVGMMAGTGGASSGGMAEMADQKYSLKTMWDYKHRGVNYVEQEEDNDSEEHTDENPELNDTTEEHTDENPDKMGLIRKVKNAHLVYKRRDEGGKFDELWIYKVEKNDIRDEISVRRDILSGTDIKPNSNKSDDGSQTSSTWTAGNIQFLEIRGLPN